MSASLLLRYLEIVIANMIDSALNISRQLH
jgi:hypothetical protein